MTYDKEVEEIKRIVKSHGVWWNETLDKDLSDFLKKFEERIERGF